MSKRAKSKNGKRTTANADHNNRIDFPDPERAAFLSRRRRKNWFVALSLFAFCAAVFAWFVYRTISA